MGLDLNQRRALARRIYSPVHLTALPPIHGKIEATAKGAPRQRRDV